MAMLNVEMQVFLGQHTHGNQLQNLSFLFASWRLQHRYGLRRLRVTWIFFFLIILPCEMLLIIIFNVT